MDLPTLVTTIATSSALIGAATYFLRKYFDQLLTVRFREIEERNKAQIYEFTRRQAALFDQQLGPMRTALSLVYRLRNAAREIADNPDHIDRKQPRERSKSIDVYFSAIEELLYEERAIMPNDVAFALHNMKTPIQAFIFSIHRYRSARRRDRNADNSLHEEMIRAQYATLDAGYEHLAATIRSHLHPNESTD